MKKTVLFFLVFIFSITCFSQISFKEGYFIENTGKKTECFIKNIYYSKDSQKVEYKLSKSTRDKTINLRYIKEIVIYNTSRFIRKEVAIGKPNELNKNDRDYIFNNENLVLKVLVEGAFNLYSHRENGIELFFYGSNEIEIEQLVFKQYNSKETNVKRENNLYQKQLFDNLDCEVVTFKTANNLKYNKKDLIDFFAKFNKCKNSESIVYNKKTKIFNVSIRPRIINASIQVDEIGNRLNPNSFDFGNKTIFGIGAEFEAMIPFLNNKWAFSIEPIYQSEYSTEFSEEIFPDIGESTSISYKSFLIPITIRHYSYLNQNSKIFLNASVVPDFSLNSFIRFTVQDVIRLNLVPASNVNFSFGGGYKYKNKYSVEARYYTKGNIVNHLIDHTSSYNKFSIILGYTLF